MAIVLKDLVNATKTLTIPIGAEGSLEVRLRPYQITMDDFAAVETEEAARELIVKAVDDWDLESEPGTKVPITLDAIGKIPAILTREISKGIMKELTGVGESEGSSFA